MNTTEENKPRILIAEDDPNFGSVLKDYLTIYDFDVTHTKNGIEATERFKKEKFDVCILDIMMPYKDGFAVAKEIRQVDSKIPIIFLTAKTLKEDILKGYKVGADDYLTKPFDSEVLLFKLRAILQKNTKASAVTTKDTFHIGRYIFNSKLRSLKLGDTEKILSPKENELLKMLAINEDGLIKREDALKKIWKEDNYFTSRSMDVYIAKLRKILKEDNSVEILNLHGEGFRLVHSNS